ncbi:Hypothetical protein PHPALM_5655 [Phytophthora palmivora]|uniref:Uncharacterized protein n=1 Tax=Phytophthora palmivora TaxID=4796 RepID=A0A2P4YGV2_9STRA|nr:Hypothetical protein PHPALM_5655 [Phytophthora palmivora]
MADLLDDASNVADDLWRLDLARDQMYPQFSHPLVCEKKTYCGIVCLPTQNLYSLHTTLSLFIQTKIRSRAAAGLLVKSTALDYFSHVVNMLREHYTLSLSDLKRFWEGPMSTQVQRVQLLSARLEQVLRVRTTVRRTFPMYSNYDMSNHGVSISRAVTTVYAA